MGLKHALGCRPECEGVRWRIKDRWSTYASYAYAVVDADDTGNTPGVIRRTSIKFNPTTLVVSIGCAC
jgi:hypothetical protein